MAQGRLILTVDRVYYHRAFSGCRGGLFCFHGHAMLTVALYIIEMHAFVLALRNDPLMPVISKNPRHVLFLNCSSLSTKSFP